LGRSIVARVRLVAILPIRRIGQGPQRGRRHRLTAEPILDQYRPSYEHGEKQPENAGDHIRGPQW
jgi:hypothetical protein